jgi:hypothetical protein
MQRKTQYQALNALAHPVSIGASVVLLLNATVWQPNWPSWWTGKIGDFAWLIIAPSFVALLLTLCLPRIFPDHKRAAANAIFIIGLGFCLVKTFPPAHALAIAFFGRIGFVPKLVMDPSDLLALPALLVTWLVWNTPHWSLLSRHRTVRLGALTLAALALIADAPGPVHKGVVCLTVRDDGIYAYSQAERVPGYFFEDKPQKHWTAVHISEDGGVTWEHPALSQEELDKLGLEENCSQASWPLEVGQVDGNKTQLHFVSGQGVYSSKDAGQTLKLEQKLAEVYSALVDPTSGNLILAAGLEGIYVRTPAGEWSQITP